MGRPAGKLVEIDALRKRIMRLGKDALRASHYPELLAHIDGLREANEALRRKADRQQPDDSDQNQDAERLRNVLRGAPVGIGVVVNRVFTQVNQRFCRMTGYAEAALIGRDTRLLYQSDEDYETVWREQHGDIGVSGPGSVETRWVCGDGRVIDVLLSSTPLDVGDPSKGVIFTALDVTERKRTEEALRASERTYQEIFNATNDVIFVHDLATGAIIDVNRMACERFGYTRDEMLDLCVGDLSQGSPPFSDADARRWIMKAIEVGPQTFEWLCRARDGGLFWVETSLRVSRIGGQESVIAVGRDIDERKRAEEALRDSEERMELALRGADLGTWDWNVVTGEVVLNQRWAEMLGYAADEIAPHVTAWEELVHPDDLATVMEELNAHLEGRSDYYESEHRLRHKSGDWIWVLDKGRVIKRDADGKPLRACGTHLDVTERVRAVEALARSEQRLREAQRIAKIGDFTWDVGTGEATWSDALFELLHYDKSEEISYDRVNAEIHHPEDLPRVTRWLEDCLASDSNELTPNEYRLIRADGEVIDVRTVGVIERPAGGTPKMFATVQDITDRRRAEQAERERAGRLRLAMQAAHMGMWEWDVTRNRVTWSPETLRIFGTSEAEFGGTYEAYADFVTPEGREQVKALVTEFLEAGRDQSIIRYEHGITRGDGQSAWVEVRGTLFIDDPSGLVRMTGVCTDITERKRAEEALLREKALSEHYINSLPGLFYVFDEHRFVRWNKAWEEITGYSGDELCTRYATDFFDGADKDLIEEKIREVFREGVADAEAELVLRDGRRVPYYFTGLRRSFDGRPHFVGFGIDITDRRRVEAERQELEGQLRQAQKLEAVGQLAGGVAHDFNNLLTAILGNVELSIDTVRDALGADHGAVRSIEQIEKAAQRASALTRQLLAFSRRGVSQPRVLCLNDILTDLDQMLRRLISEDIHLRLTYDSALKSIFADAGQLEQVVVNLVVNAGQAMPDGGCLTLETRNVMLDQDYIHSHAEAQPGPHVLLAVSDTGQGMDAATQERIFEPFFTTKPMDQGTGLGLATVHGIVRQSGGHVLVYSEPGRGTTFRVYLPAVDAAPEVSSRSSHADERQCERGTILLCEDDGPVRELTARSLRIAGYEVITAGNGQEGLDAVEGHSGPIDLLITDVIMPDMNGRAVAERLSEARGEMAVLYISGYTSDVIAQHGVLEEGVEFLEKPFTRQGLLDKVREVLAKAKSRG